MARPVGAGRLVFLSSGDVGQDTVRDDFRRRYAIERDRPAGEHLNPEDSSAVSNLLFHRVGSIQ
jgi:hypothetical protein